MSPGNEAVLAAYLLVPRQLSGWCLFAKIIAKAVYWISETKLGLLNFTAHPVRPMGIRYKEALGRQVLKKMGQPNSVDYDAELQRYRELFCRAWNVAPFEQVLDVGCGAGQTTRDAARLA